MGFSAACKARLFLSTIYGTAEAVPFQNPTFTTARLSPQAVSSRANDGAIFELNRRFPTEDRKGQAFASYALVIGREAQHSAATYAPGCGRRN